MCAVAQALETSRIDRLLSERVAECAECAECPLGLKHRPMSPRAAHD
jgi:hypothetical protein